jgi:hypothetical protein
MGPIGCFETSVRNYRYWLRYGPEEGSSLDPELFIENQSTFPTYA